MVNHSINLERDLFPRLRSEASNISDSSSKVRNLFSSGAESTLSMLEETWEEAQLNPMIMKYWLGLLLIRLKKDSRSSGGLLLNYLDFIIYFAKIMPDYSDVIFKEYSIPLSVEIATCSVNQLIEWANKLNDLRDSEDLKPSIMLMIIRLKQEAFQQMARFMQAEEAETCNIIIDILIFCLRFDPNEKQFLNVITKNLLEKFIEEHKIDENPTLTGEDKHKWVKMKEIVDKIVIIEDYLNKKNKKLVNKIKNCPIIIKPPKTKSNKKYFTPEPLLPFEVDLKSIEYESRAIYSHTFASHSISVMKGVNKDNKSIILKQYHSFGPGFDYTHILKEIEIMTFLSNHSHSRNAFVKLYHTQKREDQICLWMEDGGVNLMNFITETKKKNQKIPPQILEKWIELLVENFAWLNENKIYHQDIKPHNILVNQQDMSLKIIDFSVGNLTTEKECTISPTMDQPIQGTDGYMASELVEAIENNRNSLAFKPGKSDVFSLGLTILQMITLERVQGLNLKMNNQLLLEKVNKLECSEWIKKMLKCMFDLDWRRRFSFKSCLAFLPSDDITRQN